MLQIASEAKPQVEQARPAGVEQPLGDPQPGAVRLLVALLVVRAEAQLVDGVELRPLDPLVVLVVGEVQLLHGPQMPGAVPHLLGPRIRGVVRRLEGRLVLQDLVLEAGMREVIGEAVAVTNG